MSTLDERIKAAAAEWLRDSSEQAQIRGAGHEVLAAVIRRHLVPEGAVPIEVAVAWAVDDDGETMRHNVLGWTDEDYAVIRGSAEEALSDYTHTRTDHAIIYIVPPKIESGEEGVGFGS